MTIDPTCFFKRQAAQYYVATETGAAGSLALVLPSDISDTCITFQRAVQDTALSASFLYSSVTPTLAPADIVSQTLLILQQSGVQRGVLFPTQWAQLTKANTPFFGITPDATSVSIGMVAPIFPNLALNVVAGTTITADFDNYLWTFGGSSPITFSPAPTLPYVANPQLAFSGAGRGAITFGTAIERQFLGNSWNWGFQYLVPKPGGTSRDGADSYIWEWLPLANPSQPASTDQLGFNVTFDASDPLNQQIAGVPTGTPGAPRTQLAFTGTNIDRKQTLLISTYSTNLGSAITLYPLVNAGQGQPAAFVFNAGVLASGNVQNFQVAPYGDFILGLGTDAGATPDGTITALMGGLTGTEYFGFQPVTANYVGDRLRFAWGRPAYAPAYPFPPSSPVGPPAKTGPLLQVVATGTETFGTTSWATFLRATGAPGHIAYLAQPNGAALYGNVTGAAPLTFGTKDPCVTFSDAVVYVPLAPYSAVTPGDGVNTLNPSQIQDVERRVIAPTRRSLIGQPAGAASVAACITGTPTSGYNATTPSSQIVTLDGSGIWKKVFLALNQESGRQMAFCMPPTLLQQALQTNDLFMVAANATNLGAPGGPSLTDCPATSTATFLDTMNIEDWLFEAKVGQQNVYGDYRDVFIIKGTYGPLYDPANIGGSLVANPAKWTLPDVFSVPTNVQQGDPSAQGDIIALSGWLQEYFAAAAAQPAGSPFDNFNRVAKDEYWTGILILRMTLLEMPTQLVGLKAGMSDPTLLNAHHFGIDIARVKSDVTPAPSTTSMFGLIYYVDPDFVVPANADEAEPVPPAAGSDYDFRLLMLEVLFENSAVSVFRSYAQLTLNKIFDMTVDHMGAGGNPYNTILLQGSYQNNNGQPVYGLSSIADSTTFFFLNEVFNKIEITTAAMSTLSYDPNASTVSWFGMTGFLDFAIVKAVTSDSPSTIYSFDVFSFGSIDNPDTTTGRGLNFSNLGVMMTFDSQVPTTREFEFVSAQMRFDVITSTPRPQSLFLQFALTLQGLLTGTADSPPADLGYAQLVTDARLNGVAGQPWYALRYQLNMGTPGALAGKTGLTSFLVTAWTIGGTGADATSPAYNAYVGLELPGMKGSAKLLSLQNVLRLSIGNMFLTLDRRNAQAPSFLLMLTSIALQLLGLLKIPPNGSTIFYLFGNPQGAAEPSGLGWYAMYKQDQSA